MSGTLHDDMSKFEPEVHTPQVERDESKGDPNSNPNDGDTPTTEEPIEAEPVE